MVKKLKRRKGKSSTPVRIVFQSGHEPRVFGEILEQMANTLSKTHSDQNADILKHVKFESHENHLVMVCADGHRLVRIAYKFYIKGLDKVIGDGVLFHANEIRRLSRLLQLKAIYTSADKPDTKAGMIIFKKKKGVVDITGIVKGQTSASISSVKHEKNYPEYEKLIPNSKSMKPANVVYFNARYMMESAELLRVINSGEVEQTMSVAIDHSSKPSRLGGK